MKCWLVGASGQLGQCLQQALIDNQVFSSIDLVKSVHTNPDYPSSEPFYLKASRTKPFKLDITDFDAVMLFVLTHKPQLIINTAAYTEVDNAESNIDKAYNVNHKGARNLALVANQSNIPIIHISTDFVFDGQATIPYLETHSSRPINVYGASKRQGELAIQQACSQHVIIRTSWLISEYGNNFAKTIIRLAQNRNELRIVDDQMGCPTSAHDLADVILTISMKIAEGKYHWGTFHYCGSSPTTWFRLSSAIVAEAMSQGKLTASPKLVAINTEDFPLPAKRPQYSALDCSKIAKTWGGGICDWQHALKRIVSQL
ncbi:dTDP-4-dehydrorhamnose reductase [Shewanella sp. 1_MG-2023]|uniref:dTDP-4-dehydrorhamnose reductase n=1 Tax=unclassified Shewanella TaxID=196818 RepID=UPI0026E21323|nr:MULTISPECIES: dTDP-4-dehydrorhamnose reductase [unclassified Shewanella]MDO6610133.1 dTDP-4-dehydrorhamnose reductase [Shewanella sp. 7_MG-2023]MDO6769725.1 dTDP-4-dehydrorhamnose reductase [Shewanella sp. 2_MG-2023]MDO6792789.1 dTDP-4-dehydrorhamnose reductase [Shewanella sp. 1_MG-2023]